MVALSAAGSAADLYRRGRVGGGRLTAALWVGLLACAVACGEPAAVAGPDVPLDAASDAVAVADAATVDTPDAASVQETAPMETADATTGDQTQAADLPDVLGGPESAPADVLDAIAGPETTPADQQEAVVGPETEPVDIVDTSTGPETNPADQQEATVGPETKPADTVDATAAVDSGSDSAAETADTAPACPGSTAKPDGSCCPSGQSWDAGKNICAIPGPLGCTGSAAACQPRWCVDWTDAAGQPCAAWTFACTPSGRACTAVEVASGQGCSAGMVPAMTGSGCEPAGTGVALPAGAAWAGDDLTVPDMVAASVAADKAVPPLPKIGYPPAPLWCPSPTGPVFCTTGAPPGFYATGKPEPFQWQMVNGPDWICPPGFLVNNGAGAACLPDPADCGTDAFAGIQDGANIVFVDGSFAGTSTGKRLAPFKTIFDATYALTAAGGTIAIAAGNYVTAIDTGVPLTIRGRCAAKVTLVGKAGQAVIHGGFGVTIKAQGLSLTGGTEMVRFDGAGSVELLQVDIGGGARLGIAAKGGAKISATSVFVHDILPTPADGSLGTGAHADTSSSLALTDVRITGARHRGVNCDDAGTVCTAKNLSVTGTLAEQKSGEGGIGIAAAGGAKVTATTVLLTGNHTAGALAFGAGTTIGLELAAIEATTPAPATASNGYGLFALSGGGVTCNGCRLDGNTSASARGYGGGTTLSLGGSMISSTKPASDGNGFGVVVGGGAKGVISNSLIGGHVGGGVQVADAGSSLVADLVYVSATAPNAKDGTGGVGLAVAAGASAQLSDLTITKAHYGGIYCNNATLGLQTAVIEQTACSNNQGGYGIVAQAGCTLTATGQLWVDTNKSAGIFAAGGGTALDLAKVTVSHTLPRDGDNWGGRGIHPRLTTPSP